MVNLVVVGAGDHYRKILRLSLEELQRRGYAQLIATVDIDPVREAVGIPHLVRHRDQPLSDLLRSFKAANPIVYLAHAHGWHTRDTLDLAAAGFRVAVEKPYAISTHDLGQLVKSLEYSKIFLVEYYLMMKATPLLHACKLLATDSFLHRERGFLSCGPAAQLIGSMTLTDVIGALRFVYVDILEGEGETGRFEHRGVDYADRRRGGGSIMDLGVHAFTPLIALAPLIGDLYTSFHTVESAVAEDFLNHALNMEVPRREVPETYSATSLISSSGVPVSVTVAKYTPNNRNQRRLILVGDAGEAILDMSLCALYIARGDSCPELAWQIPKNPGSKYVPVLRTILEEAEGRPQYAFGSNDVCVKSQELALAWQRTNQLRWHELPIYRTGMESAEIRRIIRATSGNSG